MSTGRWAGVHWLSSDTLGECYLLNATRRVQRYVLLLSYESRHRNGDVLSEPSKTARESRDGVAGVRSNGCPKLLASSGQGDGKDSPRNA